MILFSIIRNHNKKIISIFHVKQNLCFSIAIYKQSLNRFSSFYVRIFSFTLRVVNSENICTCICSKVVFLYHSNNCEWKCMHVQIRDKCSYHGAWWNEHFLYSMYIFTGLVSFQRWIYSFDSLFSTSCSYKYIYTHIHTHI